MEINTFYKKKTFEIEILSVLMLLIFGQILPYEFYSEMRIRLNPFPHNDNFWHLWETSLLKTLWEKEKLLVTSNFSFSHSVFYLFGKLSSILVKFEIVPFQFGRV